MGIFDNKFATYSVDSIVNIEELYRHYLEKVGGKYKVELERKGKNALASALKGVSEDRIFVAKNGYHRTYVTPMYTENLTTFRFDETTVSPWITFLQRQTGLIGLGIIRLCYGKGEVFYKDVVDVLRNSYTVTEGQINVGISRLWKKDEAQKASK